MAIHSEERTLATNKKAYHDYTVLQKIEAGIVLQGTEVKSAKSGNVNLKDGFAFVKNGEMFLRNVHISPYPFGNRINHDPLRERKLLLHKREISKLEARVREKGFTLIPLRVYTKKGRIKVELGLVKGKKLYDKREAIRKKDQSRDLKGYPQG
ncbi:MAG: SsrA-binding protein SmpB [Spirochaetota bacterium]